MLKSIFVIVIGLLIGVFFESEKHITVGEPAEEKINTLSEKEKEAGWKLLFDGETFKGWRGLGRDHVPEAHWKIEKGAIRKLNSELVEPLSDGSEPESGDLATIRTFDNYELSFEWKVLKAGNSGLKYNVSEELSKKYGSGFSALGFEYQLLDERDPFWEGKLEPSQFTASLYDMIPASNANLSPAGEFNRSRILIQGNHVEHWLNGKKVVEYEFGSDELLTAYEKSKFKKYEGFINKKKGHIILQNHQDDAWFRNIKIREIK